MLINRIKLLMSKKRRAAQRRTSTSRCSSSSSEEHERRGGEEPDEEAKSRISRRRQKVVLWNTSKYLHFQPLILSRISIIFFLHSWEKKQMHVGNLVKYSEYNNQIYLLLTVIYFLNSKHSFFFLLSNSNSLNLYEISLFSHVYNLQCFRGSCVSFPPRPQCACRSASRNALGPGSCHEFRNNTLPLLAAERRTAFISFSRTLTARDELISLCLPLTTMFIVQ